MLFLIETMQFKHEFIKRRQYMQSGGISKGKIDYGIVINLYDYDTQDQIPKSTIVYKTGNSDGNNNGGDCYSVNEQIRMIFDKYISNSAGLQINISSAVKNTLFQTILSEEFVNNHDDQFLIKILDDAILEIILLLNGSWNRFKLDGINADLVEQDRTEVDEQITIALQNKTAR